jgi:hypothetical protein
LKKRSEVENDNEEQIQDMTDDWIVGSLHIPTCAARPALLIMAGIIPKSQSANSQMLGRWFQIENGESSSDIVQAGSYFEFGAGISSPTSLFFRSNLANQLLATEAQAKPRNCITDSNHGTGRGGRK